MRTELFTTLERQATEILAELQRRLTRLELLAFWLVLYGSFANWFFVSLAAIFGTSGTTPIAGEGYEAAALQEQTVSLGLVSIGLTMVIGLAIVVYGLFSRGDYGHH